MKINGIEIENYTDQEIGVKDLPEIDKDLDPSALRDAADYYAHHEGEGNIYGFTVNKHCTLWLSFGYGAEEPVAELRKNEVSINDLVCEWDHDVDDAIWLAEWDLDGSAVLDTVADDDDYNGPCRIWVTTNYYKGTWDAPHDDFMRDDTGEILDFSTVDEAREYLDTDDDTPVYLSHGQAGADNYCIVVKD